MRELPEDLQAIIDLVAALHKPEFENEPAQLTTPPGIKFLVVKGMVVGMYFNEGEDGQHRQCLSYCELTGQFEVHSVYRSDMKLWTESEGLPLTSCKYGALKPGDFSFSCNRGLSSQFKYKFQYGLHLPPSASGAEQYVHLNEDDINTKVTGLNVNWDWWKVG